MPGHLHHPDPSLTVVVKGLYRLSPGRLAEVADDEELAFPTGDLPRDEEDEAEHPELRYASDLVPYKPRTDLIFVGRCHAPGDEPAASCRVTFQVGGHGRTLQVFGDRWWAGGGVGHRKTDPQPFTEMELSWERAYGGAGCPDNPVGRGDEPVELDDGRRVWPLPNVEYPEQLVSSPDDRPAPAGFGPVPMGWEPRRSKAGTYDERWLQTRWPWYPEDLDWGIFNAAHPVLQREGFLRGDEEIYLENLHPEERRFRARLPGLRVRAFVNELPEGVDPPPPTEKERREWSPPPRDRMVFREIALSLDTVWVDAEEGLVALVWRGHGRVRDPEHAEVLDLFVVAESLDEPPADVEACRGAFWARVDEEEGGAEEESEPPAGGDEAGPPGGDEAEVIGEDEAGPVGGDEAGPPGASERGGEGGDEPEEDEGEEAPLPWTRERVAKKYGQDRDLAGADLRGLDLSEMELASAELAGADLTGAKLAGSKLDDADLAKATLVRADLTDAELPGAILAQCDLAEARLPGADLTGADLTGARMRETDLRGADLTDALLQGARLRESDLTDARAGGAVFVEADLSGAVLIRGHFEGSDFTGGLLDGVDARGASFASAEFGEVRAVEAMLAGANLRELRAADALDLSRANLTQVEAPASIWSGATLEEAVLAWAVLDGADFTGANLRGADFYAAHLREARFSKASLLGARLAGADAFEAHFDGADLTGADLRSGSFYGAEFLEARFRETATEGADLTMTKRG